jgi:hypothetical protein
VELHDKRLSVEAQSQFGVHADLESVGLPGVLGRVEPLQALLLYEATVGFDGLRVKHLLARVGLGAYGAFQEVEVLAAVLVEFHDRKSQRAPKIERGMVLSAAVDLAHAGKARIAAAGHESTKSVNEISGI